MNPPLDLTVRIGCRIAYETAFPTPILLVLRARSDATQRVRQQSLTFSPHVPVTEFDDGYGNQTDRAVLQPGLTVIEHDALVDVSSLPDNHETPGPVTPVDQLPPDTLRYTLPSRYCDSDKLLDFAWSQFGSYSTGLNRVIAICNWVHHNIEYRYGAGRSDTSAFEVVNQRFGVCRDFAHVAIAFCRAFNLPARYVTGHLPDIGWIDPGSAMDFHAYFEVYLGQKWCTFDARFNAPRIGRVKIAQGLDAVDGAFCTIYGQVQFKGFDVWSYQVNPAVVSLGDPIDLTHRLDGKLLVRHS